MEGSWLPFITTGGVTQLMEYLWARSNSISDTSKHSEESGIYWCHDHRNCDFDWKSKRIEIVNFVHPIERISSISSISSLCTQQTRRFAALQQTQTTQVQRRCRYLCLSCVGDDDYGCSVGMRERWGCCCFSLHEILSAPNNAVVQKRTDNFLTLATSYRSSSLFYLSICRTVRLRQNWFSPVSPKPDSPKR